MPHYNVEMYVNERELLCNVVVAGGGLRILAALFNTSSCREVNLCGKLEDQTLVKKLDKAWESTVSSILGELGLSSFTCQLKEHLPKQVTSGSMLPNTNETPNYFWVSVPHWHPRFLRGMTSCASMPNVDSSLRRNRWTEVPTGWKDG